MALQRKALKEYFTENVSVPVKAKQVARALGIKGEEYGNLRDMLHAMADEGLLRRVRRNSYILAEAEDTLSGRLQLVQRNYGFVIPDSGSRDIFVRSFNLGDAFDGDRVTVKVINRPAEGNPEGAVMRILRRGRKRFIGTFTRRHHQAIVVPQDDRLLGEILLPGQDSRGLIEGQKVLVEVFDWGGPRGKARARVVQALKGKDLGPDRQIILKYELPEKFPALVLKQGQEAPATVEQGDLDGREDFRGLTVFTIDPVNAADFDDALSAVRLPEGALEVGVHIADVSRYVPQGSRLDREACERGMSVYLNDAYLPMLPPELSAGICSLSEGRDRLTLSVLLRMSPEGEIVGTRLVPGVIRSAHRFTYEEAQAVLDGDPAEQAGGVAETLGLLRDLCEKRRARRRERGYIDLDLPEPQVIRDSLGHPVDIQPRPRLLTHRLVEEFMVTANETVARTLQENRYPAIFRVHGEPDFEAVQNMNLQLISLDPELRIPDRKGKLKPGVIARIVDKAGEREKGELASSILLRGMKRALYSTENIGHFGLASPAYTHFTSPIRRYPDLVIHRLLKRCLSGEILSQRALEALEEDLSGISLHCSYREELIDGAERESNDRIRAEFMEQFVGQQFEGTITAVRPFGLRVRLRRYFVEGFVHVTSLTDDFYELDEKKAVLEGRSGGRSFRLGQMLEVVLTRSDPELRRIDLALADSDRNGEQKSVKARKGARR
jgi:ribonuclease R